MKATFFLEDNEIEQYKDENVNVTSSVASIKDITANTTDYSNSFQVPASNRNNNLFKHYYDATINNTFDARKTQSGEIYLGGVLFKSGKWQLQRVNVKNGKAESYTINFSGKLTSLKDSASSLELKDLDLSSFDHAYNSDNVLIGLISNLLKDGDLVYNLFAKKQYYYNSDNNDNTQTETLSNIAYNDGSGDNGVIWNDLKPSLKVIRIIEAIEAKLGISFSRDFFGTSEFTELFLWLNNDDSRNENTVPLIVDFDGGSDLFVNLETNIGTYPTVPWWSGDGSAPSKVELNLFITAQSGYETIDYEVRTYVNDELFEVEPVIGNPSATWESSEKVMQNNDEPETLTIYFEVICNQEFEYTASLDQRVYFLNNFNYTLVTTATADTIESTFVVSQYIPEIKIIDFLKGLFSMYKLIIIPISEGNFYVDTLKGFYSKGNTYDITKYIDFEAYDVERGVIFNNINFKFQDPTTIVNIEYKKNNGVGYGDEDLKLYTDSTETELLDGDSFDIELPFEQIVYERLRDLETDNLTNIQYAAIVDESLNPVNPKPHLHYNGSTFLSISHLGFITDVGTKIPLIGSLNTMLHGDYFSNPSYTTTFDDTFSTWDNTAFTNNLYTNHYQKYFQDIFNIKKRTFKFKAKNVPLQILTKLALNDALLISGNYYRIDNFQTRILQNEVDFELINIFDEVVNPIVRSTKAIYVGHKPITKYQQLTNTAEALPSKLDMGNGTGWVTLDLSATIPNLLEIEFDENDTGLDREMTLQISVGTQTKTIYLYQYAE